MTVVVFTVPGQPIAKGRPRISTRGGHVRAFTPARTVAYENLVALAAQEAMAGRPPIEGAAHLNVEAVFAIPSSWSKRRRLDAARGLAWHTSKPDSDNLLKAVADGCNGIVWRDDKQAASTRVTKVYGETPGLRVLVEKLPA